MDAKYLVVYDGGEGEVVEDIGAVFPHVEAPVLPEAFIVEPVDLRYLPRFVVSPEERHPPLVSHFQGEEQDEGLDRVQSSIDEVPEEEVGDEGRLPADPEQLQQVVELPVDIAAYRHRGVHAGEVGLLSQDFLCLVAQQFD